MLTRLFGQSKPINFLLIAIYMSVFYSVANAPVLFGGGSTITIFKKAALLLLYVLSMVLLNFIAKKNDLNRMHTYSVIIYASFTVLFFDLLQNNSVITANIFVILALRRIISLRSNKDIKKKIFDASLWLCLASLFQFWVILLLSVVAFGVIFNTSRSWKNFMIPVTAMACVFVLSTTYTLLAYDEFFGFFDWFQQSSFNFSAYHNLRLLIPLSLILAMVIWVLASYFKAIKNASISQKPSMYLIVLAFITCVVVAVCSPLKNGSELLFMFAPLAAMTAKYFEREEEFWFKEVLLILLVSLPIIIPIIF